MNWEKSFSSSIEKFKQASANLTKAAENFRKIEASQKRLVRILDKAKKETEELAASRLISMKTDGRIH